MTDQPRENDSIVESNHAASSDEVVEERRGSALWLRLNRPAALNAVTPSMIARLGECLDGASRNDSIRSVVITGAGNAFCAGADLKAARSRTEVDDQYLAAAANATFTSGFGTVLAQLEHLPKPTIAAINGIAAAAGLEILLCCDFAIAAAEARIGDSHGRFGLIPGGGSTARLPRRMSLAFAKYLLYTGELVPATELAQTGLLLDVVPQAALESTVDELAAKLAARSPLALRRVKRLVDDGLEMSLDAALRAEREINEIHSTSDDRREGLAAFAERRPPKFTGR